MRGGMAAMAVSIAVFGMSSVAHATDGPEPDRTLGRRASSALIEASDAIIEADGRAYAGALERLDRLLERGGLSDYETAMALNLRGRLVLLIDPAQAGRAADDFARAVATGALNPADASQLAALTARLLAEAGDFAGLVAFHEANADAFGHAITEVGPLVAEGYARQKRPQEGLDVLTQATETIEVGAEPLQASRYVMLLQMRRWDEARAALEDYAASPIGPPAAVEVGRAQLEALASATDAPDGAALREAVGAFLAADEAWRAANYDAEPKVRVPPRDFGRCLSRNSSRKTVESVQLEFDVAPDGRTTNVRALESTDRCFERHAVEAVEAWSYKPAMRDGAPSLRRGVRTMIKFEVSG